MNSHNRMINELLATWINDIDDDTLLDHWAQLIAKRRRVLSNNMIRTRAEIIEEMKRCERGDKIFLVSPITFSNHPPQHYGYFVKWQPRVKRLWLRRTHTPVEPPEKLRWIARDVLDRCQPSRTDVKTRRRAAGAKP